MPRNRPALVAALLGLLVAAPSASAALGGLTGTVTNAVTTTTTTAGGVTGTAGGTVETVISPLPAPVQEPVQNVTGGVTGTVTNTVGTVTNTVGTVTNAVGGVTGTVTDTVGAVTEGVTGVVGTNPAGGLVSTSPGLEQTLAGLVGPAALGGSGTAPLPASTVTRLLTILGVPANRLTGVSDSRAPKAVVTVVSRLRSTARTGKVKLRVTSTEPSVVVLGGTIRPGKARKGRRVSRKPVHLKPVALAFRKRGVLNVTVVVSRTAQRHLAAARDARISVQTVAVDVARNQARAAVKRSIKR